MNRRPGYSPEVRERAVRMVLTGEHEHTSRWAAVQSVASKIGAKVTTPVTASNTAVRGWKMTQVAFFIQHAGLH